MIDMTLLGLGAFSGIIYAGWSHVKMYLLKIYSLLFLRIKLDKGFSAALKIWTLNNATSSNLTVHRFMAFRDFIRPLNKSQHIAYKITPNETTIYWHKKKPFIVDFESGTITCLRWMFDPKKLVKEILDYYNESLGECATEECDRFYVRRFGGTLQYRQEKNGNNKTEVGRSGDAGESPSPSKACDSDDFESMKPSLELIGWKKEEIGQIKKQDPFSHLSLTTECKLALEEIRRWKNSKDWYKQKQIPHKKGILFYGKPGCGKSSVAKAMAMDLNIPIMIFDLSNMSNDDFQNSWSNIRDRAPCMVLIEDIDAVFDGRKNVVHEEGGLSFDCILNCIDGVENSDGILIVATTNNIDKIDPALGKPNGDAISTRPGRIDRALELLPPDEEGRRKIASRILDDFPTEIEKMVKDGSNDTGAQFQERCSRLALKLFWESKANT